MILTDDNFTSIKNAVEEGRGVYANIIKFITWILPTNVGQGLVVVFAVLLGLELPLSPVQILWVNMTTAVMLGLTLAFEPKEVGLMTPQLVEGMIEGSIKGVLNIGEDLTHIHPNINKLLVAFENLELIFVQELFMTDIARRADIVVGVKSAYEKTGIYINAMRKVHLSTPLVHSDLPDDWEVIKLLDEKMGGGYGFKTSGYCWQQR
jgi:anaerobic selenocysteine-containing dehydrogenase